MLAHGFRKGDERPSLPQIGGEWTTFCFTPHKLSTCMRKVWAYKQVFKVIALLDVNSMVTRVVTLGQL